MLDLAVTGGQEDGDAAFDASTPKLLEEVAQVPIDEVRIVRKIGEGAFGEVSFANVESHGLVAIKWLKVGRHAERRNETQLVGN